MSVKLFSVRAGDRSNNVVGEEYAYERDRSAAAPLLYVRVTHGRNPRALYAVVSRPEMR